MPAPAPLAARLLREAAVLAGFLALAAWATRPLVTDLTGSTLVGPDPLIDLWTVNWLAGHLLHPGELFGGNVFHPEPNPVLFSDLSLGTAVLLAPLAWLGVDAVPLYNAGVLLALGFAGWAFHALTHGLTGSRSAGLLAGVLAAFASHQLYHIYHLNLLTIGWLALELLALDRVARQPHAGWSLLLAVSFAFSVQSSGYYAVAAALLPLVFAAVHWRAWLRRRAMLAAAGAALLGALLVWPYVDAFTELRERERLQRPPGMSVRMAFQPGRDLGSSGHLWGALVGRDGERLFPGLLAPALALAALVRRGPHSGFYAVATLTLLVMSLGPRLELAGRELELPYAWLFAIPPLDSMRHPYTFAAVATFLLAVLAGIGWAGLPLAKRRGAGAAVVGLAVIETLAPGPGVREIPRGLPQAWARVVQLPPGPVLEVPFLAPDAMLWAARHGWPTINGDGAFRPGRHGVLADAIENHWVESVPEDLDESKPLALILTEFPLRYIIVPGAGRRPDLWRLGEAFERSRILRRVDELPNGDRIFEMSLPESAP